MKNCMIYKVVNGVLHSLVVRETAKMYIYEDMDSTEHANRHFGWITRFRKEECCTTPLEAIRERKNQIMSFSGTLQDKLEAMMVEFKMLDRLESEEIQKCDSP